MSFGTATLGDSHHQRVRAQVGCCWLLVSRSHSEAHRARDDRELGTGAGSIASELRQRPNERSEIRSALLLTDCRIIHALQKSVSRA